MLKRFFQSFDIGEGIPKKIKIAMEVILVLLLSLIVAISRIKLEVCSIELYFIVICCTLIFCIIHPLIWINKHNKKEQVRIFIECIYYIAVISAIGIFEEILAQNLIYCFIAILFATLGGRSFSIYLKKALSKY